VCGAGSGLLGGDDSLLGDMTMTVACQTGHERWGAGAGLGGVIHRGWSYEVCCDGVAVGFV
jgi:hypothetical protein